MFIDEERQHPQSAGDVLGALLDDVTCSEVDANRYAARQAERLLDAVEYARRHPEIYTIDANIEMAERAVVLELALRLRLSQERVRELCVAAETARRDLPLLWERAHSPRLSARHRRFGMPRLPHSQSWIAPPTSG